ncbi:MAG: adenosylcobinamide amidohydrolase [Candidatus Bathyarchaeia archaeon]
MRLKIPINGIEGEVTRDTLLIKSKNPLKVLSSAVLNGGPKDARVIINHRVIKRFKVKESRRILERVALSLNLNPKDVVGLMTGADVMKAAIVSKTYKRLVVSSIVTAGISNTAAAGNSLKKSFSSGTINIIALVNASLTENCSINAIQTITEAKCMALRDLDIRSRFSKGTASGTTTDAIVLASKNDGKKIDYAGTATKLGELIGKSVREAVKNAIFAQEKLLPNRPLFHRLRERGIQPKALFNTAMKLCSHCRSAGFKKEIVKVLREEFEKALSDVNAASLIIAGLRLDEDGRNELIPGLNSKIFNEDPAFLIADEILGITLSNYIAGTKGIFEYLKFCRLKPKFLKRLGPFTDDVVGGLIAGVSSKAHLRVSLEG